VYAGVDYKKILRKDEREAEVILWDGGNNDAPFIRPDLMITIADPLRAGNELNYYPGETVARMADVIIINKANSAERGEILRVERNLRAINNRAKVVIADMQEGEVAQNIVKQGGSAKFVKTDVRNSSQVQKLVDACVSEFGGIDVVCNNAGVGQNQPVSDTTEEDWDRIVDTNLKSVFLVSKYAVPRMVNRQEGVIVNTSSQLGLTALPGRGAYCASKAGVILLTRVLALEYAKYGIRVNCVCPGPIQTPMLEFTHNQEADPAESRRNIISRVPLARIGMPDEIAQAVLFLASKRSSYITGQHIVVDGGYVIL
jgi:dihydroanticapsin dehydrogenase